MTARLVLERRAWKALTAAAKRAIPREAGGILLGHFTSDGPRVVVAPVVPDPRATRIRYCRDAAVAERILQEHQHADPTGLLGYLGEWHTHPLPLGPSRTDLRSVRALAGEGGYDVTLLVLSLSAGRWIGHVRNVTPEGNVQVVAVTVEGPQT